MSTRYDDRDYERRQRNYGRRSDSEFDRSYGERSQRYGRDESERERERERYTGEGRWRGQYGGGYSSRSGREYQSGRQDYGTSGLESERDYTSDWDRGYGSSGRPYYGGERGYAETSETHSQRYNYPTGFRSGETYDDRWRGRTYGERGRDYDYDRSDYRYREEDRGWWDRLADRLAAWFGDEEAERRRRMDERQRPHRGKGPKGYRRSDERIREDVNDRLSEGYLDASDIEVAVMNSDVTLTGTVNSRYDKRRAEEIAEEVSGVANVENRLRVKHSDLRYSDLQRPTGSETSGTTGTSASSAAAGSTGTARGRTAGT